jgi:hypothetical protein
MNKIASMFYLMRQGIPTSDFHIIGRENQERYVTKFFYKTNLGWVIRCGRQPDIHDKPEMGLPWRVCSSLDDVIGTVKTFYRGLREGYHVFMHPQREMVKSGNLLVLPDSIIIEAVSGWPEGLSHGTQNPQATYKFRAPSLFTHPSKIEGDKCLLSPQELHSIGNEIERRLDYAAISALTSSVVVEFSVNSNGKISAHDIRV